MSCGCERESFFTNVFGKGKSIVQSPVTPAIVLNVILITIFGLYLIRFFIVNSEVHGYVDKYKQNHPQGGRGYVPLEHLDQYQYYHRYYTALIWVTVCVIVVLVTIAAELLSVWKSDGITKPWTAKGALFFLVVRMLTCGVLLGFCISLYIESGRAAEYIKSVLNNAKPRDPPLYEEFAVGFKCNELDNCVEKAMSHILTAEWLLRAVLIFPVLTMVFDVTRRVFCAPNQPDPDNGGEIVGQGTELKPLNGAAADP